jgi:competence protein ComEC
MPLVLLAAYATGIVMACFVTSCNDIGNGIIAGAILLLWVPLRHCRLAWVPVLGLLGLAGFIYASLQLQPPNDIDHVSRLADGDYHLLEGEVLTVEQRSSAGYRLLIESQQTIRKQQRDRATGKILLYVKEGEVEARPGQIIRWRSRLRRPVRFGNPGEFDYPLYLAARDIYVTAFVKYADDIVVLVNHPRGRDSNLENYRYDLAAQIRKTVPEEAAGYLQALLLGLRGGIDSRQREVLAGSGVAHLFAISGLHFGLLAMLLYVIGKWIYTRSQRLTLWCPPQRILPVCLLLPLAGYLMLSGNAWATQRAFLMVSVVAILILRNRRTRPYALLATVAFFILLDNPLALFQPGFQLSFSGVAGILAWLPCWQKSVSSLTKPLRWPLTLALTTAAATVATAPAVLWHFHQFAPAGLLTNLVAIPLIAWGAVPIGLISLATLPFSTVLADGGLLFAAKLVTFAITLVTRISHWPGLAVIPSYLTVSSLILLVGLLLTILPVGSSRGCQLLRIIILILTFSVAVGIKPQRDGLQVTALSVGQGDATLVSLGDDIHYLVDGGGMPGSTIDTGERLVAPALGRLGIDRLKGVILTHNHPDHSSGLTYILQRFPVENFYSTTEMDDLSPELQRALTQQNVNVHRINEGWTSLHSNAEQTISLFAPSQRSRDINERSIAVFAGQKDNAALLTADLGKSGLQQILNAGLPGRVSLLKLPHHGSRYARPELYLDALQPAAAFVSSGRGNVYGFPHQQTIEACVSRQKPLYRTDQQGMLVFQVINGQWQSKTGP